MATMIPGMETKEDFNASGGELLLYELLQQLPSEYVVFHSTHWNEQRRYSEYANSNRYIQWGEADFTIFHPVYGFIVFEVKDGIIQYSREKGWQQINRSTGTPKIIDPMNQAERSKYYFLDLIKRKFHGNSPYTFCSAVWFTSADRASVEGNMPLNYSEDLVLWNNDLKSVTSAEMAIRRVYNYCGAREVASTDEMKAIVIDTLSPEFGVFPSVRSRMLSAQALFRKMTTEQMYLLDYLSEQDEAAIHGVAGTGKTVLAVQKAKELSEQDHVLFLCFNRFLKEHLEKVYSSTDNVSFFTLDGLVSRYTNQYSSNPTERAEIVSDFLLEWDTYNLPYKHIIIDEGQDFADEHLQLLHSIAKTHHGVFYVFYDRNQFVQGLTYAEWLDEMECRLVLSRNCRNTKEIAMTSTRPIGIDEAKVKMRRETSDTFPYKPNMFFVADKADLKDYLSRLIKKYVRSGVALNDIVVLSMKPEGKSVLQENDFRLQHYLLGKEQSNNTVLFTTVRKFKGLEAQVVICIDIDETTFSSEKERNVFYVGTSRAMTCLELLTLSTRESLANSITGNSIPIKQPQATKIIRDFLKIKIGSETDLSFEDKQLCEHSCNS